MFRYVLLSHYPALASVQSPCWGTCAVNTDALLAVIQSLVSSQTIRVTQHAQEEMDAEDIALEDVLQAIASGQLIENYPDHRRGACCLLFGRTAFGRPLHVVCTTTHPILIIITVYEPTPPKWVTPTQRRQP